MISQGLIGATPKTAFRATNNGVDAFPNVIYDKQAPFAIGTMGWAVSSDAAAPNARCIAQFVRVFGVIAIGGTATVANGVATAGAGTWTNETGVALGAGDYVWLTAGVTPALAADEEGVDLLETADELRARQEREAKETPEERKARKARDAKETPEERKARTTAELRKLRKAAKAKAGETEEERVAREAEEAEYQKAEKERAEKAYA